MTTATDEVEFGVNKDVNYSKPKPKPDVRISDISSDGDANDDAHGVRSGTSNDSDNIHDNVRGYNKSSKTAVNVQLPITFFVTLVAGVVFAKKIFS